VYERAGPGVQPRHGGDEELGLFARAVGNARKGVGDGDAADDDGDGDALDTLERPRVHLGRHGERDEGNSESDEADAEQRRHPRSAQRRQIPFIVSRPGRERTVV
jgi:hypothetical protein